ncbi:hypothetical protein [Microbacterium sp. A93]|uniref:hypothetical protein n=1 Tax=Microbacterium sp. A93 TaxID=3450716 RepID=UPI003F436BA6
MSSSDPGSGLVLCFVSGIHAGNVSGHVLTDGFVLPLLVGNDIHRRHAGGTRAERPGA